MAWPFSTVVAPNVDSDFITLTNALVNVPTISAGTFWLLGLYVENPTAAEVSLIINDANGKTIYPTVSIPSGAVVGPLDFPFMPVVGIPQWKGLGLVGKMWGYQ